MYRDSIDTIVEENSSIFSLIYFIRGSSGEWLNDVAYVQICYSNVVCYRSYQVCYLPLMKMTQVWLPQSPAHKIIDICVCFYLNFLHSLICIDSDVMCI